MVVPMTASGRAAAADAFFAHPLLYSRSGAARHSAALQKLSSCISIAHVCQKINLSSLTALERLRGITSVHCRYCCSGPRRNTIRVSR